MGISTPQQATGQIRLYTDQEAEEFAQRLDQYKKEHSFWAAAGIEGGQEILQEIGIDVSRLQVFGSGSIFDCVRTWTGIISTKYTIEIYSNACINAMVTRISVVKR